MLAIFTCQKQFTLPISIHTFTTYLYCFTLTCLNSVYRLTIGVNVWLGITVLLGAPRDFDGIFSMFLLPSVSAYQYNSHSPVTYHCLSFCSVEIIWLPYSTRNQTVLLICFHFQPSAMGVKSVCIIPGLIILTLCVLISMRSNSFPSVMTGL